MNIPSSVARILDTMHENGFEAYAVGGCVRDSLIGRTPEDWDITTNALPEEVKRLFRHTVDTGIQHGTVTVLMDRTGYEVTTYRLDGNYSDGRHPDSVTFTPSLEEDLKRRDFTINAMALSHDGTIVDLFDGQGDLSRRVVRCVGDPDRRFSEDALRILRAVRFSAQLDFTIGEETWRAVCSHAPSLDLVSRERVFAELNKTLLSDHPEKLSLVRDAGMVPHIHPSLAEMKPDERIARLPKKKYIRWAALFDGEREALLDTLAALKSDNETAGRGALLAGELAVPLPAEREKVRRLLSKIGPDRFRDLILLSENGFGVSGGKSGSGAGGEKSGPGAGGEDNGLSAAARLGEEILAAGDCLDLSSLAVTGKDLIRAGVKPGPEIGRILSAMLDHVLSAPEDNRKELLLKTFI